MIIYQPQHPLSSFRFDPITLLTVALIGTAGFGAAEFLDAQGNKSSKPVPVPLPNQQNADTTGKDTIDKQRRLALLTGGQTDFTGGSANVGSGDVNKQLLLGG